MLIFVRGLRARALRISLAIVCSATACLEPPFAHSNVNDALSDFEVSFEGIPDTLRRYRDEFTARVVTSAPVPVGAQPFFVSSNPVELQPWTDGRFEARRLSVAPLDVTVSARLGAYVREQQVTVYSEVSTLSLSCLATVCGPIPSLRGTVSFRAVGRVSSGAALSDLIYAFNNRGAITVRDTAVLGTPEWIGGADYRIAGRRNGESWVVFRADAARDSVLVTVRQLPVGWTMGCPALPVGDTAQLTATDPVDGGGNPVTESFQISWTTTNVANWTGDATISADGTVTALAPGMVYASASIPSLDDRAVGTCAIEIR